MTLSEIWKRIGKQKMRITQNTKAKVFVDGEEYCVKRCRYDNGKLIGFECEKTQEE